MDDVQKEEIRKIQSYLGKRSAEVRSRDKRFNREYYSKLGKKSAESKRRKREGTVQKSTAVLTRILNGEY